MPKLVNDFIRPVTPSQIRGEDVYLPASPDEDGLFPGMATLSRQEVADLTKRVFYDYVTTKRVGGLPNIAKLMENIAWVIFAYAYETESDVRESRGEQMEAELLREAVRCILDAEDAEIDAVLDAGHLLTTAEVLKSVQNDILQIVRMNRLSFSFHDSHDQLHYENLPKVGFSSLM